MTDAKFEPFEPTDLTPYIDQINAAIRETVEQYVAERNRQIAAFLDAAAPSAAQDDAEQGQDGGDGSERVTGHVSFAAAWGEALTRAANAGASIEDIRRHLAAMTDTTRPPVGSRCLNCGHLGRDHRWGHNPHLRGTCPITDCPCVQYEPAARKDDHQEERP